MLYNRGNAEVLSLSQELDVRMLASQKLEPKRRGFAQAHEFDVFRRQNTRVAKRPSPRQERLACRSYFLPRGIIHPALLGGTMVLIQILCHQIRDPLSPALLDLACLMQQHELIKGG